MSGLHVPLRANFIPSRKDIQCRPRYSLQVFLRHVYKNKYISVFNKNKIGQKKVKLIVITHNSFISYYLYLWFVGFRVFGLGILLFFTLLEDHTEPGYHATTKKTVAQHLGLRSGHYMRMFVYLVKYCATKTSYTWYKTMTRTFDYYFSNMATW